MTKTDSHLVYIIGDGATGRWLNWRWADGRMGVHEVRGLDHTLASFHHSLPQFGQGQQHNDDEVLQRLGLYGPMTRPDEEQKQMSGLTQALLPEALRDQLIEASQQLEADQRIQVRVMPSPKTAMVPWGLLPLTPELRLLEVANISWIAPILPRDVEPSDTPVKQPSSESFRAIDGRGHGGLTDATTEQPSLGTLHVCNPHRGLRVIDPDWERCDCGDQVPQRCHGPMTVTKFGNVLQQGYSRLLVVGHCESGRGGDTGIKFDHESLLASRLSREPDQWQIPPRVGVVACASGTDLRQPEPFGLATGLLLGGAETAQLTLWVLPTDEALRRVDPSTAGQFAELARAVDHALGSEDPVRSLNDFQRTKLAQWRTCPGLATSPLIWGAAFTMTAPYRRGVVA